MSLIAILSMIVPLLSGCATTPMTQPTMRMASVAQAQEKIPISCVVAANRFKCAFYAPTVRLGEYYPDHSRADLSECVFGNLQSVLNGLFFTVAVAKIVGESQNLPPAQLYVMPEVIKTDITPVGAFSHDSATFTVEIRYTFFDQNRVPIFNIANTGKASKGIQSVYDRDNVGKQRAYDAIYECTMDFANSIISKEEYNFLANNIGFFTDDDASQCQQVDKIYPSIAQSNALSTMLMAYSARKNNSQLMEMLIKKGIPPNIPYGNEESCPIHLAADHNNAEGIACLAKAGVNINQRDKSGHLPLYYSTWKENKEATEALLSLDSDMDIVNENLLLSSGLYAETFGDYYVVATKRDRARAAYQLAMDYLQRASAQYEKASSQAAKDEAAQFLGQLFAAALQGAAMGAMGAAMNTQNKQTTQIMALRHASNKGTGVRGYYAALPQFQQTASRMPTAMNLEAQRGSPDPGTRRKAANELKKQADEAAQKVKQKLAALDTAPTAQAVQ